MIGNSNFEPHLSEMLSIHPKENNFILLNDRPMLQKIELNYYYI